MSDDEVEAAAWVQEMAAGNGYLGARVLPGGERWAAVAPFMFTSAVIVGEVGNAWEYADRWCYATRVSAALALAAWDGEGEPVGWHRHPATGRRVSLDPDEINGEGKRVGAVGVLYVRR